MKNFKKLLTATTLGIAISIGGFATNLHASDNGISTNLETYLQCKENLCHYMFLNGIQFMNFFDLRYNLDVIPYHEHQFILENSQQLAQSLSYIGRNFYSLSQVGKNDIVKNILKAYCFSKNYDYNNILNIITSNVIVRSYIYPFQNASIDPEIQNQHGIEICIKFARELTENERFVLFEHGITPRERSIYFGI